MENLVLWAAMHLKKEREGFHLHRPQGQAAFNFVHFLTPALIVIDGEPIQAESNACILYTPNHCQEYCSPPEGFINNFLTFNIDDPDCILNLNLPINEPFYVDDPDFITESIEYVSWAKSDQEFDHSEDIRSRIEAFFKALPEIQIIDTPQAQRAHQTKKRFMALRTEISKDPGRWSVEKMAKAVYLTRSYFYTQYKAFFGLSPGDDLIALTLAHAKRLLVDTDAPIADIAHTCGYSRPEYFTRIFKQHEGITPGAYRKRR
jgi:AraC-type DNA-binding domain-containing proteins